MANRTVTFHGVARDAARLLVPLFEGWTLPSISQLPSVQRHRNLFFTVSSRVIQWQVRCRLLLSNLLPQLMSRGLSPKHGASLIDVCRAKKSHLTGLREDATLRSLVNTLVARPHTPPAHSAAHVNPEVAGPLPEVPPWRVRQIGRRPRVCRREGCSAPAPNRCRVRFCQDHCTSPRCNVHARQTRSQERHCHFRGCQAMVPAECSSGFCDEHCSSPQCSVHNSTRPSCTPPGCNAPPSPGCLVGCCAVHCTHSQCSPQGSFFYDETE